MKKHNLVLLFFLFIKISYANSGGVMYPGNNGDSLLTPLVAQNKIYVDDMTNNSYITIPLVSSPLLAVNELSSDELSVSVYPNPFSEEAALRITNSQITNYEIKSYDVYGKEVGMNIIKTSNGFVIRRRNLVAGIYFLKLKSEGRVVGVKKNVVL